MTRFDASVRHPVFLTEKFRKAPVGVEKGGDWGTPVARGYVFEHRDWAEGERRRVGGRL